jgi:hypothetical protein
MSGERPALTFAPPETQDDAPLPLAPLGQPLRSRIRMSAVNANQFHFQRRGSMVGAINRPHGGRAHRGDR